MAVRYTCQVCSYVCSRLKLPKDDQFKKVDRGTSEECVTTVDGVDISNVVWKDNKTVMLLSTLAGKIPMHQVERYDRKNKKRVTVDCPEIVKVYNKHMGGVDLLDSIMGRNKIKIRSKKWYFRLFYHLLDMSIVNAWLLYKRVETGKTNPKETLKLS